MDFCEKCGSIIIVKEGKASCANCKHKIKKRPTIKASEKIEKLEPVAVVKQEYNTYPIIETKCPKCKNKRCYFWTQQTRAADEAETKFFKCTKCSHSWREYR